MNRFTLPLFLLIGIGFFGILQPAYAGDDNRALLPVFPTVSVLSASQNNSSDSAQHKLFEKRFSHALANAFLELGIKLYDRNLLSGAQGSNLATGSGSLLMLELELLEDERGRFLPYLSAVNHSTGEVLAMSSTLSVLTDASSPELEAASISLTRMLSRQLADKQLSLTGYGTLFQPADPHVIRIALEQFDRCEQNYIMDTMSMDFPGFVFMELEKSPTQSISYYRYQTIAPSQKIQKWLTVLLFEHGLISGKDFMIIGKSDNLRLVAKNKTPFVASCL